MENIHWLYFRDKSTPTKVRYTKFICTNSYFTKFVIALEENVPPFSKFSSCEYMENWKRLNFFLAQQLDRGVIGYFEPV